MLHLNGLFIAAQRSLNFPQFPVPFIYFFVVISLFLPTSMQDSMVFGVSFLGSAYVFSQVISPKGFLVNGKLYILAISQIIQIIAKVW